jgi:N-acetylmuramoyl-L-alanine amidase
MLLVRICVGIAIAVGLVGVALVAVNIWGMVTVPGVEGTNLEQAERQARSAGLTVEVVAERYSTGPQGRVLEQEPAAGQRIRRGTTLRLTVSNGVSGFVVPDLVGLEEEQARAELATLGLEVSVITESSEATAGVVLSTVPAGGTKVTAGDGLVLHVADKRDKVGLRSWPLSGQVVVVEPRWMGLYEDGDVTYEIARRLASLVKAAEGKAVVTRQVQERRVSDTVYAQRAKSEHPDVWIRLVLDGVGSSEGSEKAQGGTGTGLVVGASSRVGRPDAGTGTEGDGESDTLAAELTSELRQFSDEVTQVQIQLTTTVASGRSVVLSLGSSKNTADRALFGDSQWCDNVARALYMAIGATLAK